MKNKVVLQYLVGSLSDYEWKKLIKGLSGNKSRQREVAGFLRSYRQRSGSDAGKGTYSKGTAGSFMADKKRASRMIAEVIDYMFKNDRCDFVKDRFSEVYLERINVNKSIYLLQLLSRKNLPLEWLNGYVTSLIGTCDAFEFIGEKITLKRKLIEIYLRLNQHSKAGFIMDGLVRDLQVLSDLTTMECLVNRYVDSLSPDVVSDPVIIEELVQAVERSSEYYNRNKLEHLSYFNRLLTISLLIARQDFFNAGSMLGELNDLCNSLHVLCYRSNLSRNYRLSALLNFLRWDFRQTLGDCSRADLFSSGNVMELNLVRELQALSLIYLGEYAGAVKVLEEMISTGSLGNNELQFAKRHYFLAYALFLAGDTRKSFVMLQLTSAIGKHDGCWNIGVRLLHIFLNICAGRFDVADSGIESLRKYLQRTSKSRNYPPRIRLIFRLLLKLSYSAYDFDGLLRSRPSGISALASGEKGYKWSPGGFEVIPFDRLLKASMDVKKVDQLLTSEKSYNSETSTSMGGSACFEFLFLGVDYLTQYG